MSVRSSVKSITQARKSLDSPQTGEDPKLEKMSLTELRKEKEICIENLDFEGSSRVEAVIQGRSVDNTSSVIESLCSTLDSTITAYFLEYDQAISSSAEASHNQEMKIRSDIEAQFEAVKKRHIEDRTELEIQRTAEIMKETTRPVAHEVELRQQAKTLARVNNVEEALHMRDVANSVHEEEMKKREAKVQASFNKKLDNLAESQLKELDSLQLKLEDGLSQCRENHEKNVSDLRKRLDSSVRTALRRAISLGCKELKVPSRRPELSQKLTDHVQQKLKEDGRSSFIATSE